MILSPDQLPLAARRLAAGELIGMPTETVYGLAADATNVAAVAQVFARKGRPADHPLIVHVAAGVDIAPWVAHVPEVATRRMAAFWPGPLTLVLKKSAAVPAAVTGGQDTVALRSPAHPLAQALLKAFGEMGSGIVAAPSANRFGRVSPTTAQHVVDELGDALPVLDGGACDIGIESTIVDVSGDTPRVLRLGGITTTQISAVLGVAVAEPDAKMPANADTPRVSGNLAAHYAPVTLLRMVAPESFSDAVRKASAEQARVVAYGFHSVLDLPTNAHFVRAPISAAAYAHDLYATLRALDALAAGVIIMEAPPQTRDWAAVRDRLTRAQTGSG